MTWRRSAPIDLGNAVGWPWKKKAVREEIEIRTTKIAFFIDYLFHVLGGVEKVHG